MGTLCRTTGDSVAAALPRTAEQLTRDAAEYLHGCGTRTFVQVKKFSTSSLLHMKKTPTLSLAVGPNRTR